MKRARPEDQLHKTVADFLAVALPENVFATTFPAGGGGRVRGALLKRMGLVPGVPDWIFCIGGVRRHGYFAGIELKAPKGTTSKNQRDCHSSIRLAGGDVAVCRSIADVARALESWGVKLRARPT